VCVCVCVCVCLTLIFIVYYVLLPYGVINDDEVHFVSVVMW